MLVLHGNWNDGRLHLWGESLAALAALPTSATDRRTSDRDATVHPFAASSIELAEALTVNLAFTPPLEPGRLTLHLPADDAGPRPSELLADPIDAEPASVSLRDTTVETCHCGPAAAFDLLLRLDRMLREAVRDEESPAIQTAPSIRYWIDVARFVQDLLVDQRFVPSIVQSEQHEPRGVWAPWLHDEQAFSRLELLCRAMPPAARAVVGDDGSSPCALLVAALTEMIDQLVRDALTEEHFDEALDGRSVSDPHVALLSGLLNGFNNIGVPPAESSSLFRDTSRWLSRLAPPKSPDRLRLCLILDEPSADADPADPQWRLSIALESMGSVPARYAAEEIWSGNAYAVLLSDHVGGRDPAEILLDLLADAARINPQLEPLLDEPHPTELMLNTAQAHALLTEHRPVLEEQGVRVIVPAWWESDDRRLGLRLELLSPEHDPAHANASPAAPGAGQPAALGLDTLVNYRWRLALRDETLTDEQFAALLEQRGPLIRLGSPIAKDGDWGPLDGRWIEAPSDRMLAELRQRKDATGEMTLREALRHAGGGGGDDADAPPVVDVSASGWMACILDGSTRTETLPDVRQPATFTGSLRPYQQRGLGWLVFLDQHGFGACLADDMGLGKTIQLLALLLHEREENRGQRPEDRGQSPASGLRSPDPVGPTLLVVPTSVVSNWQREIHRFASTLREYIHHGPDRVRGPRFQSIAAEHDVVITTYALVSRDLDILKQVNWHRIVLDEAQSIKNPPTKQARAIRGLPSPRRIALTGTPLENRLSELWSIMDFCNPGYFGTHHEFQRRLAAPIERKRDQDAANRLRSLVQPFILRRLKTDPTVIDDLPPCVETKEYATLTPEQAALYQHIVNGVLDEANAADGMQRRGMVLAALIKLKQICNHPSLVLETSDVAAAARRRRAVERSGKTRRLIAMLEEILAEDGRALIFTQFRQMGKLLVSLLRSELDTEALFLHGGTPQPQRQQLIDRFNDPGGGAPVFVLSLRAGGVGLNLTAANHVFHFDRWWNPAVEQQATDRAFRIGQTRTVHVHKFVTLGTLEERIDEMIEQKAQLAENIIGSGEQWLTELSTDQLRDVLTLRESAVEET